MQRIHEVILPWTGPGSGRIAHYAPFQREEPVKGPALRRRQRHPASDVVRPGRLSAEDSPSRATIRLHEHVAFPLGMLLGGLLGILLLASAVQVLNVPARQQHDAEQAFGTVSRDDWLSLSWEWMDEQLARAFRTDAMFLNDIWQEYRVILFPGAARQLLCAPDAGPVATGFIVTGKTGLTTVMPWDEAVAFDIMLLCSIRI